MGMVVMSKRELNRLEVLARLDSDRKVLDEEISLREGADVKRITKAEAIVRGVVVGALKGDARNTAILFRLAEQVGQFQDDDTRGITRIERVIVSWKPLGAETEGDV